MSNKNLFTILIALAGVVAVITGYQVWNSWNTASNNTQNGKARVELRATDTGQDKIDKLNTEESLKQTLDQAIEDFRSNTVYSRQQVIEKGQNVIDQIDKQLSKLDSHAASLTEQAQVKWEQTKIDLEQTRQKITDEYTELKATANAEWSDARGALAIAFSDIAGKIDRAFQAVVPDQSQS